ncbi:DNA ligase I [Tieghemostelium lacteum]|uniref:DNA ligase n=1 Tax=Tieghemostelium lacteum TaxID=361077 RepID=A0A151ZE12_TIELA|nr:DNA ligase I [Tieghemostelium lacteum]|eukprot:KYQ92159.1 DNA ligase I [Tieghemostelium lacteum]
MSSMWSKVLIGKDVENLKPVPEKVSPKKSNSTTKDSTSKSTKPKSTKSSKSKKETKEKKIEEVVESEEDDNIEIDDKKVSSQDGTKDKVMDDINKKDIEEIEDDIVDIEDEEEEEDIIVKKSSSKLKRKAIIEDEDDEEENRKREVKGKPIVGKSPESKTNVSPQKDDKESKKIRVECSTKDEVVTFKTNTKKKIEEDHDEDYNDNLLEEIEDEDEDYEDEEDLSDSEKKTNTTATTTTTTTTTNNKTKFVKKVAVSKKKGTVKTIQADLKVLAQYDPIKDAGFTKGQTIPYLVLAKVLEKIEETSSRLLIVEYLTNLFRSIILLSPNELITAIYLCINKTGPSYGGKELGIGESILIKAVSESTGRTMEFVKQELKEVGDLGIIAQNSRSTQPQMFQPPPLTCQTVISTFRQIADLTGNASQKKKRDLIMKLLISCKDCEALYVIRSLQGKLRIGLAERSVLLAVAKAVLVTPPNQSVCLDARRLKSLYKAPEEFEEKLLETTKKVTRAYSQLPNYDLLVPQLLKENGLESLLENCSLKVGIPVKPMLAQPTTGISQVLDRFENMEFTCEFKYDGERAQIHMTEDGKISVYTRNLEDYTQKYPDILQNVPKFITPGVKSFILDCEAVAFDPQTQKIMSFQVLSTRARKSVQLDQIKVPVCVFAFDLLFLNGKSLVDETLQKRREVMKENFQEASGIFSYAKFNNCTDIAEIQIFLEEAITGNCEGLMVKTLTEKSMYEPSRRSYNWLKIKKDYLQGMTDSLDLVPIGAWYGKGKRTGVYGAYLLACYDEDSDEFQTVCKIGTGFSDELLTSFTEALTPHIIPNARSIFRVNDQLKPDLWFNPIQVWEVKAADLSVSPIHTGGSGIVDPVKGIALRFPRFVRVRPDKNPEDATSSEQVVEMYKNQKINNTNTATAKDEDY